MMTKSWVSRASLVAALVGMSGTAWAHGGEHHAKPKAGEQILRVTAATCVKAAPAGREVCEQKAGPSAELVLVDEKGTVLTPQPKSGQSVRELLGPYVGQRVLAKGQIAAKGKAKSIALEQVTAEHEHSSHHGGMVVMQDETHLEVLALKSGELRVYVSDDFRRPVSAKGLQGTVEIGPSEKKGNPSFALQPSADGAYLAAQTPAAKGQVEATIRLPLQGAPNYFVTLMLTPLDAPTDGVKVAAAPAQTNAQDVTINVGGSYEPSRIVLKKGVPARLHFLSKTTSHCAAEVKIPAFGVKQQLAALKETVVEVTPKESGAYDFTCGMEMMRGQIVVQD